MAEAAKRCVRPVPAYAGAPEFKPKYTLNEEQIKTLGAFRERLTNLTPEQTKFCTDACLCRYLRARDWNIEAAEKLLQSSLKWRAEYGAEQITPESLDEESSTGKLYFHGFDKHHRPVMYQKPRRQNTKDHKNQVVYFLEREISSMDVSKGVEQHVLFVDFKDYSIMNAPPMSVTKEVLTILMDHYPERLGNAFMVDAPMLFTMVWRVIRPFLPKATQEKVHFVSRSGKHGGTGKMDKVLAEYFEDHQLEEEYGGTLPSDYDHGVYWGEETKHWKDWKLQSGMEKVDLV